ncbi:MAG TPA: anthrone oxygenase family protein [Gemmatimonadales bacterium]
MPFVGRVVLWLFVINLGIALGAGLYEGRISVSRWTGSAPGLAPRWDAEAARQDDPGRRFWVFVTTGPLTLLTVASFFAAMRAPPRVRAWWLAAAGAATADRVFTYAYFIPTMLALMRVTDASAADLAKAREWAGLNYLRHAIVLAALVTALKTFALAYQVSRSIRGDRFV